VASQDPIDHWGGVHPHGLRHGIYRVLLLRLFSTALWNSLGYVCWAAYQIYKHKLLPPEGRRRVLSIYFFRLAAVFIIMWLPGLLFLFVTAAWLDPWVQWAGGAWSHLQGLASALVSLLKPDIWKAVVDFWCCRTSDEVLLGHDTGSAERDRSSSIFTKRPWANSSVYWSSLIGLGLSSRNLGRPKSRVSSYHEEDDELEKRATQPVSHSANQSHLLVSDDSEVLDTEAALDEEHVLHPNEEIPPENHDECMGRIPPPSDNDVAAPVGTIYIVPKRHRDNSVSTPDQVEPFDSNQDEPGDRIQVQPADNIKNQQVDSYQDE
jgi:hypothetical protein